MAARSTTQIAFTAILLAAAPILPAQNSAPPPCPANTKSTAQKPCTPAADSTPAATDKFPFPGEPQPPPPSTTSAPDAPDAPAPAPSKTTPASSNPNADKFPFPGEGSSSSSSSSSASSSVPAAAHHPPLLPIRTSPAPTLPVPTSPPTLIIRPSMMPAATVSTPGESFPRSSNPSPTTSASRRT